MEIFAMKRNGAVQPFSYNMGTAGRFYRLDYQDGSSEFQVSLDKLTEFLHRAPGASGSSPGGTVEDGEAIGTAIQSLQTAPRGAVARANSNLAAAGVSSGIGSVIGLLIGGKNHRLSGAVVGSLVGYAIGFAIAKTHEKK